MGCPCDRPPPRSLDDRRLPPDARTPHTQQGNGSADGDSSLQPGGDSPRNESSNGTGPSGGLDGNQTGSDDDQDSSQDPPSRNRTQEGGDTTPEDNQTTEEEADSGVQAFGTPDCSPREATDGNTTTDVPPVVERPLNVTTDVADPESFFENGTNVTVSLSTPRDHATVEAGIDLPDGVHRVAGNRTFQGCFGEGDSPVNHTMRLRGESPGTYNLTVWSELYEWKALGSRWAPRETLSLAGDSGDASVERGPAPAPGFEVNVTPHEDDIPNVTITAMGNVTGSATLRLVLQYHETTQARILEDDEVQELNLTVAEPVSREIRLGFPDGDSYHYFWAFLYPHPRFAGEAFSDEIQYKVEDGNVTLNER